MKNKTEAKKKVTVYLPDVVFEDLKRTSKTRRLTYSTIVTTVLKGGLRQSENDEVIDRRLNRMQRQYERMHKDQQILTETLASFVKVYITHTPIISAEQREEAERHGDERFERFLGMVEQAINDGKTFADLVKEKVFKEKDFKAAEDAQ